MCTFLDLGGSHPHITLLLDTFSLFPVAFVKPATVDVSGAAGTFLSTLIRAASE